MSRSFLNFVPASGTRTRFESRSRHKHRSLWVIGPWTIKQLRRVTDRLLFFGLIFILTTCRTIPKSVYQDKGVNFKITEDFKIVETKTWKHNNATYIKIERRDKNLYANFSVTWLPKKCDLDDELKNFMTSLKEAYPGDSENTPVFSEVKPTKFGLNSAIQVDYLVANDGPRVGSYTAFYCDSLSVIIGQHHIPDSKTMTTKCRQLIEDSFTCLGQINKK